MPWLSFSAKICFHLGEGFSLKGGPSNSMEEGLGSWSSLFLKRALRMASSKSRHTSKRVAVLWSLSRMRRSIRITSFLVGGTA